LAILKNNKLFFKKLFILRVTCIHNIILSLLGLLSLFSHGALEFGLGLGRGLSLGLGRGLSLGLGRGLGLGLGRGLGLGNSDSRSIPSAWRDQPDQCSGEISPMFRLLS
jgi:hypothetical protein